MDQTSTMILLSLVGIIVIFFILNMFTKYVCQLSESNENAEQFVDNYYHWNWNDPNMLTVVNQIDRQTPCKECTYSMSCDFTDDAQPFCYRSYDMPSKIDKDKKLLHHMSY